MLSIIWQQLDQACLRAFGSDVTYLPQAGGSAAVRAIFQRTAEPPDQAPGVYVVAFVRRADLPSVPVRGDQVVIDGSSYRVYDIESDEAGAVVLKMRKV